MIYNKDELIEISSLIFCSLRDNQSLQRQYKECIYDEKDLLKPKEDKENFLYRYHARGLKMLSQRMIYIDKGVYIFLYKEKCIIVLNNSNKEYFDVICKYVNKYKKVTSNVCPTVIWCCINMYYENVLFYINSLEIKNVYFDLFIIGSVCNFVNSNKIRDKTFICLQEENPLKKKEYFILEGYDFDLKSNLQDYSLKFMNRIVNIY